MRRGLPILGSFSTFRSGSLPTPGMPRLERHGAPFCQDFGSDWWSSHDIQDGSPGTEGFWWSLQQGWTQTGEAVSIVEGPRAQVSSRHKQMQASLPCFLCWCPLSLPPPSPFLFVFLCLYIPPVIIYPSICIPGTLAKDIGYNCIHSGTDMKIQFLLCVVWVSLLIWKSYLGQLWAAITLPDVRSTLSDWPKSQKTTHHNFYTLVQPYVFGSVEPIKWGEGGWQLWH